MRVLLQRLRLLPPPWAARALRGAISRHAWAFAGSGTFSWHAGLPGGATLVHDTACEARGDAHCRFEVRA